MKKEGSCMALEQGLATYGPQARIRPGKKFCGPQDENCHIIIFLLSKMIFRGVANIE